MSYKNIFPLIILSTILFGCGKVEPPTEETPTVLTKTQSNYNLDHKGNNTKKDLVANVTVVDDATGIAIDNARVISRSSGAINVVEKIEDGGYYLATNSLDKFFRVGALADGYLPNDLFRPTFPLEIRLKKGETVNVSGAIVDQYGNPVTNGVIHITDGQWNHEFYACSGTINAQGQFKLTNVSANHRKVYLEYEYEGRSPIAFRDQAFNIEKEDIYIKLQLPPEISVKGRVIYSTGEAVSNAMVWVESFSGEDFVAYNLRMTPLIPTKGDGKFEIKFHQTADQYLVKGNHRMYLETRQGPYSANNPPPEMIELVIEKSGARIAGKIFNQNHEPILKCSAKSIFDEKSGINSWSTSYKNLVLDIDENGDYISGILPLNTAKIKFETPGYDQKVKSVKLAKNEINILDVQLDELKEVVFTGTVCHAETKEPLPSVTVKIESGRSKTGLYDIPAIQITDSKGQFYFLDSIRQAEFSALGYGTFAERIDVGHPNYMGPNSPPPKNYNPKFYMSPSGAIRILAKDSKGHPLDGNTVDLHFSKQPRSFLNKIKSIHAQIFKNGEVLFTNLPSHISPVYFLIKDSENHMPLLKINNVELKAGEEVQLYTNLPPTGNLLLEFKEPFDQRKINIEFSQRLNQEISFNIWAFKVKDQTLICNHVPTGQYSLKVGSHLAAFLETNIFISVDNTKTLQVENGIDTGIIRGTVKSISGKIIPYELSAKAQGNPSIATYLQLSHESNFVIEDLSKKYIYNLNVMLEGHSTNIVIKNLKPDGPLVDIVLPDAYAITGNAVDANGKPLSIKLGIEGLRETADGEFRLYPVFSGTYKVIIKPEGYVKQEHQVRVSESDVDLGEIVFITKGLTVSGRIVDENKLPVANITVSLSCDSKSYMSVRPDENGYFVMTGIPINSDVVIRGWPSLKKELGVLSSDTDLGDLIIKKTK